MDSNINGGKAKTAFAYRRDSSARTAGAVTPANGGYAIADTATTAKVGDIYRPETATTASMIKKEYLVIEASTNSFTIASKEAPTLGDTFFVLAPVTPRTGEDGGFTFETAGLATEAKQDTQITHLASLAAEDFATQTTLAAVLAKIIAAPATEAKQDTGNTTLASILAKIIAAPATEAKQDTQITHLSSLAAEDFATQTTLAAVLAKIIAAPATEAKQDAAITQLTSIAGEDFATQTTLAAVLAKIISAPSTEAKQDTIITGLASLLTELQLKADLTETQPVQALRSSSATLANVASSASNVTLQASNSSRKGFAIFNDSTAILYVKFGATASTSSYTVQIAAGGYYEAPQPVYTGIVDGIWASANGNARMTEW